MTDKIGYLKRNRYITLLSIVECACLQLSVSIFLEIQMDINEHTYAHVYTNVVEELDMYVRNS